MKFLNWWRRLRTRDDNSAFINRLAEAEKVRDIYAESMPDDFWTNQTEEGKERRRIHTAGFDRMTRTRDDVSLEYIREHYHVPAEMHRRVTVDGKPGVIVGAVDAHLLVLFDSGGFPAPAHPTWHVDYHDAGIAP